MELTQKILLNKIAVVTGGCRGIGKAIVESLANRGAFVYALDYLIPEPNQIFIEDESIKEMVKCIQVDVTVEESVTSSINTIIKEKGKIDILVNNAGITRDNLILRLNEKDWDAVINTNLKGAFLCSKAVSKTMMSQRSGKIINIGSIVGSVGNAGQVNYSASKAGLIGLTKSLAKELGSRNILVNCISPGFVLTPMTEKLTVEQMQQYLSTIPIKKAAIPADISKVVSFFASDDSNYVTGQVLHVDGGLAI
jgi:3-oxoacyl-[acyl-carrier protein] reductase